MIRMYVAVAILGGRLAVFRYQARRAYAGRGRHWAPVAA